MSWKHGSFQTGRLIIHNEMKKIYVEVLFFCCFFLLLLLLFFCVCVCVCVFQIDFKDFTLLISKFRQFQWGIGANNAFFLGLC